MRIMLALTFAGFMLLGSVMHTTHSVAVKKVTKYTCTFDESNPFPDGKTGIAEVEVKVTGNGNSFVNVDYYSDNYEDYLGQYQEGNGAFVPSTKDEASQFALDHYSDRQ